jgi:hypothetical protein
MAPSTSILLAAAAISVQGCTGAGMRFDSRANPPAARQDAPAGRQDAQAPALAFEMDGRVGSVWLDGRDGAEVGVGGRLSLYPWRGTTSRRIGIHVIGDYSQLDRFEDFEPGLTGRTETSTHWFTAGSALGFDVVRTPRFAVDVRAGGAAAGTLTRFALERRADSREDEFEDACDLVAFHDRCRHDVDFTGVIGLGARVWRTPGGRLFFGVDYAWHTRGHQQVVGTIGVRTARDREAALVTKDRHLRTYAHVRSLW